LASCWGSTKRRNKKKGGIKEWQKDKGITTLPRNRYTGDIMYCKKIETWVMVVGCFFLVLGSFSNCLAFSSDDSVLCSGITQYHGDYHASIASGGDRLPSGGDRLPSGGDRLPSGGDRYPSVIVLVS
jgi:hypothetical protein